MSEWKTYKWGDLISLEYGKPIHDKNLLDGQYPVYGTNGKIGTSNLPPLCKHPSIIIGRKGAYRGVHYSNNPFSVIDTAFFVEPKTSTLDLKWAYYKLLTVDINKMDSGSAIPSTDRYEIYSLSVELPPLDEQRRIAGILGSLDDKIELNRRINANLEAQAQALFRSWFVDFEPFRDGPFVDSELGKIPQGWKIGTLSEIGDVIGGGTPSKIKPEYYTDNGIAWITPKDLSTNNCKFTSKGETDISELGYKNSSAKLMPRGSVLFSSRAPIGYISIAKNEICTNQGFKSIVPKKAGTCFIYYFLRNNTSKIESMASGSTFKEASGGLMKSLEVIIPSNKILTAFEEAIQPLFNMQEHNEDENARLSALRDILLPKLMAGEINLH